MIKKLILIICYLYINGNIFAQEIRTFQSNKGLSVNVIFDSLDVQFDLRKNTRKNNRESYNAGNAQLLLFNDKFATPATNKKPVSVYMRELYTNPFTGILESSSSDSLYNNDVLSITRNTQWDTLVKADTSYVVGIDTALSIVIIADFLPSDGVQFRIKSDSLQTIPILKLETVKK